MENAQYALHVIHELYLLGVEHFCISPGSRSTSLVIAIGEHPDVQSHLFIDERSCAFFALGLAKAQQKAVAMITTSGTAMANAFPAVIEANMSQVPLICISADRPFELRDSGANQTINQINLFGKHVGFFADIPPSQHLKDFSKIQSLLCYAIEAMYRGRTQPIHLNFMFQKPFEPSQLLHIPKRKTPNILKYKPKTKTILPNILFDFIENNENILFVFGKEHHIKHHSKTIEFCRTYGIIPYVDVSSGIHLYLKERIKTITHFFQEQNKTNNVLDFAIIYLGETPLFEKLFCLDVPIFHISKNPMSDPYHNKKIYLNMDSRSFCEAFIHLEPHLKKTWKEKLTVRQNWIQSYTQRSSQMIQDFRQQKKQGDSISEMECIEELIIHLNSEHCIFVSNSMPIRYLNEVTHSTDVFVGSNRGASGIDGIVSTGSGFCYGMKKRGILLIGDLACWHDLGSFLQIKEMEDLDLLVLILNNGGGGIFEYLPVSEQPSFSKYFATHHKNDFTSIIRGMGIEIVCCSTHSEYQNILPLYIEKKGLRCIEICSNTKDNAQIRKERDRFFSEWDG